MTFHTISSLCVRQEDSLREAMARIDRGAIGIVLVVDDAQRLLATITDGDLRRALLAGVSLDTTVSTLIAYKQELPNYHIPVSAAINTADDQLLTLMYQHKVHQIPLINDAQQVVDLVSIDQLLGHQLLPVQAVIMAGGFGNRLRPLTEDLPKPMLPVGDRPLLEVMIARFRDAGIQHVHVTTHFMPEKIMNYFGDGSAFGVDLSYVSEDMPLGTAGALGLMSPPTEPLLVINGDILTNVDFRAMLAYHREHNADLTVAVRRYELQIPYGVLDCNGPYVQKLSEKPNYSFFVNAGIYLLEPAVHAFVQREQRFDMTDLIETLLAHQRTVVSFPLVEYWLDIGQHADYQQAQVDVASGRFRA